MVNQVLITWQSLTALALSIGWLLPIHYPPWTTFHNDAWVAAFSLVLCLTSLIKLPAKQPWPYSAIFIAGLCAMPLVQLAAGQVKLAGTAWLSSLYLLGFLLAVLTGVRWQASKGNELANILFLAFGIAAYVSVGVQLCQWLGVADGCLCERSWVLPPNNSQRHAGNLAQPNQMATLLLFGIVALGWAWLRQIISGCSCIFAITFLLVGLALTDSRTGSLSACALFVCTIYWRRLWPSRSVPYVAATLYLLFVSLILLQGFFSDFLLLDHASSLLERSKNETRWNMWQMVGQALLQQPWLGYGWNQTAVAQVLYVATQLGEQSTPSLLTSYAHNLFLDLMLWMGIPLGLMASAMILGWVGHVVKKVSRGEDAMLVFCVIVLGVHALLEMPLYYAYFLLPFGLIVGMLDARLNHPFALITGLRPAVCVWLVCSISFASVLRDYFVVEQSYALLRLDAARILNKNTYVAPKVLVLTQLRDYIALARLKAVPNMSLEKIDWVTRVTLIYPAQDNLVKLATVLALNEQESQASYWLMTLCNLYGDEECTRAQREWQRLQSQLPGLANVRWPVNRER